MTKKSPKKPQKKKAAKSKKNAGKKSGAAGGAAGKKRADKNVSPRQRMIDAALSLAVSRGWDQISLADIAAHAGLHMADIFDDFQDKSDVLIALGRMIDKKVLNHVSKAEPSMTVRDRLFDVLMERFDVLNENRDGIIAILNSFGSDPKQAVISLPHLCRSMSLTLEAAGVESDGLRGAVKVLGLTGAYLHALKIWMTDDTPDMGRTMAALDKALGRIEQAANTLGL
jgi:AcrR family transcriptional regulator